MRRPARPAPYSVGCVSVAEDTRSDQEREVCLAGLALGLALGTKLTAVYALPVVALLALAVLPRRRLLQLGASAAIAFAAVGSLVYVQNTVHAGTPLGPESLRRPFSPELTVGGTVSTASRIAYRFVDLSGYDANPSVRDAVEKTGSFAFDKLGIDPQAPAATLTPFSFVPNTRANEDVSYFGPIGALLVLPLLLGYCGAFVARRTSAVKAALAFALPLFTVELALTYRYDPWIGRFMLTPVALGAALSARVYTARVLSAALTICGITFLALTLAHNELKPVGIHGSTPAWSLDRLATGRAAGVRAA